MRLARAPGGRSISLCWPGCVQPGSRGRRVLLPLTAARGCRLLRRGASSWEATQCNLRSLLCQGHAPSARAALQSCSARAGIPKHTVEGKLDFHAIRLAYINLVIEAGATVKEAQTLARHAKPQMTLGVYGRTREERLHQVLEQVAMVLHGETQRVDSVHRGDTAEHARAINTSGSSDYGSPHPVEATGCLPCSASRPRFPAPLVPGSLALPSRPGQPVARSIEWTLPCAPELDMLRSARTNARH